MENDNSNKNKNSDKSQTMFMIGVALIVIGVVLFYIGYSQPKVYSNSTIIEEQDVTNSISTNENTTIVTYQNKVDDNAPNYPVNINTASYEELIKIKGIGENKANLIINYRNEIGKFNSIYDLTNIKGFGEATVDNLAEYITV